MFCNKPKSINRNVPGKKNRKRKRKPTHSQVDNKFRKTNQSPQISRSGHSQSFNINITHAMSNWAQSYTAATTWQLKHQVAYWKSRAVALQYENKVLHDMIREQHFKPATKMSSEVASSQSDEQSEESEEIEESEEEEDEYVNENNGEHDDFEVSEEFIEFLKQNAKYKEDARKERERLKAKQAAEVFEAHTQEETFETSEEKEARLIEMYGDDWEKIVALETAMLCTFISECDKEKVEYWPNIPFNFSC